MNRTDRLQELARQAVAAETLMAALGSQLLNLKEVLAEMRSILAEITDTTEVTK